MSSQSSQQVQSAKKRHFLFKYTTMHIINLFPCASPYYHGYAFYELDKSFGLGHLSGHW